MSAIDEYEDRKTDGKKECRLKSISCYTVESERGASESFPTTFCEYNAYTLLT